MHLTPIAPEDIHNDLRTISCRNNVFLYFFFPSAIAIWNNLPAHVIDANNIDEFKSSLFNSLYIANTSYI